MSRGGSAEARVEINKSTLNGRNAHFSDRTNIKLSDRESWLALIWAGIDAVMFI